MKKFSAVFMLVVGLSLLGMWGVILSHKGVTEGVFEISFHLVSEFLMAILLLISGFGLLTDRRFAERTSLVSMGMLVYSVLNAAGYYGQRGNATFTCMFIVILIVAVILIGFMLKGKNVKTRL